MSFKLKGEFTRPETPLCQSCRYSQIIKGPQQYQERTFCGVSGESKQVPFPVVICSSYLSKGEMNEWEAKAIGWVLEVKKGQVVGFRPPRRSGGD